MSFGRVVNPVRVVAQRACAVAIAVSAAFGARAQVLLSEPPPDMAAADIVDLRGEMVAKDLVFTDHNGKPVRIGDLFDGERPVVLTLGYLTCPLVCPLVFENARATMNELSWTMGNEYRAFSLSFSHHDTPEGAAAYRDAMLMGVRAKANDDVWPFLTGDAETIRAFCDSVGWKYKYLPKTKDFSHPTAIIILSPDGEISNYLYGVSFKERQLRLALVDASNGKVGDVFDRILLRCYHYDPNAGSYVLAAQRVMTIAGGLTVALLGGVVGGLIILDHRRTRRTRARAQQASWAAEVSNA